MLSEPGGFTAYKQAEPGESREQARGWRVVGVADTESETAASRWERQGSSLQLWGGTTWGVGVKLESPEVK